MRGPPFLLTLREPPALPLDVTGILPATVAELDRDGLAELRVRYGNCDCQVGDFFEVGPHPRRCGFVADFEGLPPELYIKGCTANVVGVGAGMTFGYLNVEGDVGPHAGARMTGGALILFGNAGDWLGAEMAAGLIRVSGNAGACVGGAYRGSRRGMSGGDIKIDGDAGDELGLRMRRGFIHVRGSAGEYAGAAMIAGTILIDGAVGGRLGAGMKRGTIALKTALPELPPGFVRACEVEEPFSNNFGEYGPRATLYRGDLAAGGRGEVFVFNPAHRD